MSHLPWSTHFWARLWRTERAQGTDSRLFSDWLYNNKGGDRRSLPARAVSVAEGNIKVCETKDSCCYLLAYIYMYCVSASQTFIAYISIHISLHIHYMFLLGSLWYSLNAVNEELESQPACCPVFCILACSGTKHIHTLGLSPKPSYNSAVPSVDNSANKCKHNFNT